MRRKSEDTSSSEEEMPIKEPKNVNMATHDLMYDSDAHVYMCRINPNSPDLSEDSDPPSSPVAQPSEEAPTFLPFCSRMFRLFLMSTFLLQA